MPIDKKKLAAVAGAVKPPQGKRFGIAKKAAETQEPDMEEAEEDESGAGDRSSPQAVIPFLEQYADEVTACCDEADPDLLIDPDLPMSEEDKIILQEGAAMLPPRLRHLLPNLKGISYDDAAIIAAALQEREKIEDADAVAGWLFRIGEMLGDGGDLEESEESDDEE